MLVLQLMGKCIRNQLLWIGRLIKTCYSSTETKVRHTKKILQVRSLADYKLEYLHCSQHTSTDSYSLQFLSHVTNNMLSFFNVCFCINLLFNIHLWHLLLFIPLQYFLYIVAKLYVFIIIFRVCQIERWKCKMETNMEKTVLMDYSHSFFFIQYLGCAGLDQDTW